MHVLVNTISDSNISAKAQITRAGASEEGSSPLQSL